MNSQLIIHSTNQRLYCCCFCWDAVVCLSAATSLQLWDVLSRVLLGQFNYGQQLAPISVNLISKSSETNIFLLQDKTGLILLIQYRRQKEIFKLLTSYEIESIGFTKICPWIYVYNQEGFPLKSKTETFCTVYKNQQIEQRNIISGYVTSRFICQENKFVDVTAMIQCQIQNKNYFLIAQQGLSIKKIEIDEISEFKNENIGRITLESEKQIKIILQLEPIEMFRVVAVLREDRVVFIDLKKMEVYINIQTLQMIRSIKVLNEPKLWALSQKKAIGIIDNKKIIKRQKIFTQLIIGIETCQWGIIGASEQGKLFALPL